MPRLIALTFTLIISACTADPFPAPIPSSEPITWSVAPGGSQSYSSGSSIMRCWRVEGRYDCLRVGNIDRKTVEQRYHAVRYLLPRLPVNDVEFEDWPLRGYFCDVDTVIGYAAEGFSPGEAGKNENLLSLNGVEPIGRPLDGKQVTEKLAPMRDPKTVYFDCLELAGVLKSKGPDAVLSDEIQRTQLMLKFQ